MAESARTLGRRRRSMLGIVAVLAGLVVAGTAARTSQPSQPSLPVSSVDRNINDYVLFATDSIHVKGGNGTHVAGGHVGVNRRDILDFDQEANLSYCVNGQTMFAPGVQVVADSVRMSNKCEGGDVFANTDIGSEWPRSDSYTLGGITFPIVASMPVFPTFTNTCTGNGRWDIDIRKGEHSDTQGIKNVTVFRDVTVKGTMVLKPDTTYHFCNLRVSNGGVVTGSPTTVVNIVETLEIDGGTVKMGSENCQDHPNLSNYMRIYVQGKSLLSHETVVSFGKYSEIWAHVWAARGQFKLGHSTELHGKAWGQRFTSDHGVEINPCPIPVPATTTTATTAPPATTTAPATTTTTAPPTTTTTVPPTTTTTTVPPTTTTTTTVPPTTTTTTTVPPATTTTTTLPDG